MVNSDTSFKQIINGGGLYVTSYSFTDDYDFLIVDFASCTYHDNNFSVSYQKANNSSAAVFKLLNNRYFNYCSDSGLNRKYYYGCALLFNVTKGDKLLLSTANGEQYFTCFAPN